MRLALKDNPPGVADALAQLPGVTAVRPSGEGVYSLECERGSDPREEVFRAAVERGWVLLELARERGATLEDLFVRLTTHDAANAANPAQEPQEPQESQEPKESQEVIS